MALSSAAEAGPGFSTSFRWTGYTLGFAIGGFFDGILLHQVLQWHHLLAGLEGGRFENLRFQILADGLFHLLMYVVLLAGLLLLWRSRAEFAAPSADRLLIANALIGFGAWHVVDALVSHWVLGIHRIRMDSDIPLFWDLLWFVLFGIAFIAAGWLLRPDGRSGPPGSAAAPAALALAAVLSGSGAAFPPAEAEMAVVVFRAGTTPADASSVLARAGGRLVWSDPTDQVWAVDLPEDASLAPLYAGGALIVSNSILPVGCLNWVRR